MVIPSRSCAAHCYECILCAVPALSCRRLRCFSMACILHVSSRKDRTSLRHRERGSSDPQARCASWILSTLSTALAFQRLFAATGTTCPGSPLTAFGIGGYAQSFSDLSTARAYAMRGKGHTSDETKERYAGT
jgi:hypothetical protein